MFVIELDGEGGCDVVLRLHGELDLASVSELERQLSMLESQDPLSLTIDLNGLRFMDSTGLHTLLGARQRALESGRDLSLVRGTPAVQRVFTTTGTDTLFAFVEGGSQTAGREHGLT